MSRCGEESSPGIVPTEGGPGPWTHLLDFRWMRKGAVGRWGGRIWKAQSLVAEEDRSPRPPRPPRSWSWGWKREEGDAVVLRTVAGVGDLHPLVEASKGCLQ